MRQVRVTANFFNKINPPTGGDPKHLSNNRIPHGKSYVSHTGMQQKMRYLRRMCKPVLKDTDEESLAALERLDKMVVNLSGVTMREYTKLCLIALSLEMVSQVGGVTWAQALNISLEKMEDDVRKHETLS